MMDKWASVGKIAERLNAEPVGTILVIQEAPETRRVYHKYDGGSWRRVHATAPGSWWAMIDNENMAERIHAAPFGTPWSLS